MSRSQLINQELTIRPEANIESNVPEGLDLYKVIFEVESDTEAKMSDVEGSAVQNNSVSEQVSQTDNFLLFSLCFCAAG